MIERLKKLKEQTGSWIAALLVVTGIVVMALGASADVRPDATATEAGGSCTTANAHTNMDDDVDSGGDGNVCTADSNSANHDIRIQFASPLGDPVTGTNAQTFKVLAKRNATGGNGSPTVALDFYCSGSLVEAGSDQTMTDSYASYSETFTFSTGSCANDGSDVEVFIDCTTDGGGPNKRSCSYEAVEWVSDYSSASPPTLTTSAASDVGAVSVTANGNITDIGTASPDERGFVYDTTPRSDPGNTAPGSSAYSNSITESGTFGTGAFTGSITGLASSTTYYIRSYAHNTDGYAYGSEINFTSASVLTTSEISSAQADYLSTNGKYFQVITGNVVPSDYSENNVSEALGANIGSTEKIDVHEAPGGIWSYDYIQ